MTFLVRLLALVSVAATLAACESSSTDSNGACSSSSECDAPALCVACDGGGSSCATAACVEGQCATSWGACRPDDGAPTSQADAGEGDAAAD